MTKMTGKSYNLGHDTHDINEHYIFLSPSNSLDPHLEKFKVRDEWNDHLYPASWMA